MQDLGVGKTTIALQIAEHLAKNKKSIMFVSLEMADTQLIQKMIAREGNIQGYRMRRGTLEEDDWNRIAQVAGELSKLEFNIFSNIRNIQELELEARKLKNKGKLDVLFIDYIQLLKSSGKYSNREQEVADISRKLKLLTLELDIPIIALCQLNRNAQMNEPKLSDLRESGSLEMDADNIIFLYREDDESDIINLKLAKQRAGEIGIVKLKFDKQKSNFINIYKG